MNCSRFKFCRLCMKNNITTLPLSTTDLNNVTVIDKLKNVLPEIINEEDNLPYNICINCHSELDIVYRFRNNCLKAYNCFKENNLSAETTTRQLSSETINAQSSLSTTKNDSALLSENSNNSLQTYEFSSSDHENIPDSIQIILDANMQSYILKLVDQNVNTDIGDKTDSNKTSNLDLTTLETTLSNENVENYTSCDSVIKPILFKKFVINGTPKWQSIVNPINQTEHTAFDPFKSDVKIIYVEDHETNTYWCKTCDKKFKKFVTLYWHLHRNHFGYLEKIPPHKLKSCLKTNIENVTVKRKLCNIISNETESKSVQTKINRVVILPKAAKCDLCDYKSDQKALFDEHISRTHQYKCDLCPKAYHYFFDLKAHKKTHPRIFQCEICSKTFQTRGGLYAHREKHEQFKTNDDLKKVYQCNYCEFRSSKKFLVDKHGQRKHGIEYEQNFDFKCDICSKMLMTRSGLKYHRQTHFREKIKPETIVCHICGWIGKGQPSMVLHMRRHNKEQNGVDKKPKKKLESQVCPVCGKVIENKHIYKQHVERHDMDNWKYKCEYCDKRAYYKTEMTIHMRIHTNERPYVCELCDKTFYMKSTLKKHLDTHTGIKRYVCDICGNKYGQSSSLKKHKLKVHHINLYKSAFPKFLKCDDLK